MKMVLTLGMSRPLSMIVVATRMSASRRTKLQHRLLPARRSRHLAVADRRSAPPARSAAAWSAMSLDVVDAVVDEVDLPVAVQLAQDGVADQLRVEADDARLDGQAVRRRRLQVADVADAQQRQVQRARDRRRRQRQHVHRLPQPLEPFLVLDAEALLLVDDDQAQVLELHVGADQAVRADDDVDAALRPAARGCASARRRCGTG